MGGGSSRFGICHRCDLEQNPCQWYISSCFCQTGGQRTTSWSIFQSSGTSRPSFHDFTCAGNRLCCWGMAPCFKWAYTATPELYPNSSNLCPNHTIQRSGNGNCNL